MPLPWLTSVVQLDQVVGRVDRCVEVEGITFLDGEVERALDVEHVRAGSQRLEEDVIPVKRGSAGSACLAEDPRARSREGELLRRGSEGLQVMYGLAVERSGEVHDVIG